MQNLKRWALTGTIIAALYTVLGAFSVSAEVIHNFDADITINPDASIDVVERIDMDFEEGRRHGIYRAIPVIYNRNGGQYDMKLKVNKVQMDDSECPYSIKRQDADELIKFGDPLHLIVGQHKFAIAYHVRRAINFIAGAPELYWNVTGDEWPYEIQHATATLHAPPTVPINSIRMQSFSRPSGSTTPGSQGIENGMIKFSAEHIAPSSALTIVAQLPEGSINPPPANQALWDFIGDWWQAFLLPVVTLFVMEVLWWNTGRDADSDHPVAVEWNPPTELSPAEVGTLIDESCDLPDVVSTLVDLAVRGYLKITQLQSSELAFTGNDYEFSKLTPQKPDHLLPHEQTFLNAIFSYSNPVKLSYLRERFSQNIPLIQDQVYQSLQGRQLFVGRPDLIRNQYLSIALLLIVVGVFTTPYHLPMAIGLMLSGIIVLCLHRAMPARTAIGSRLTRQCLGFARYVKMAEKDRLRVLAKDDPTLFGRLLPYAMVLHCADQWAHAFEGLMEQPPDWYTPYGSDNAFSSIYFVNDLGRGVYTMQNALVASSSAASSGSGFSGGASGGGFGGGGGGSW